jgi:hypothetical protein
VSETLEYVGQRFDPIGREDADDLALDPSRIGQRPQEIEYGPRAQLDARGSDVLHGAVMARGHEEAGAGFPERAFDQRHVSVDVDPEGRQNVGRAAFGGQRPVAVLGHRHAAPCDHELAGGGDVIGADGVAAGAAGVDRAFGRLDGRHLGAHAARRAGDLVDRFAAHPERHEKAADLGRRGLA